MGRLIDFLKTTAFGGLFVLLPILLLYLLVAEALDLIVALATPIADLFPKGTFDQISYPVLLGLILILIVSFLIGLALRSLTGRRIKDWIERKALGRLPAYGALKNLTTAFAETKEKDKFRPALLDSGTGQKEIVYIIEDHGDGQLTVLVPWSPTAFAGSVKIVSDNMVELMDSNLGDVSRVLSYWGVGVRDLLGKGSSVVDTPKSP
jgi:uncharacterized membrane protein